MADAEWMRARSTVAGLLATAAIGLAPLLPVAAAQPAPADARTAHQDAPPATVPELARGGSGVVRADLNGDGHDDIVVSNEAGYGVYLFVPPEEARKGLEWKTGWTRVMREGKPGDAGPLPRLDGSEVSVGNGFLRVVARDGRESRLAFEELLRVPAPAPKSPGESLATMRVRDGFTVTLAAAEPDVVDPVFIDWDERGRMWVAEMGDYPFAEGEATPDGKVTWQDGIPGEGADRPLRAGRIRILEDADGDGRYEKSVLFLDGLKHVTGLACWNGGVFVASVPDILFAKDEDGDGRCDTREAWFSGFTAGNPQHLVNGFCWGLDGWFYGANGDSGGKVTCRKTGAEVELGRSDFRFHPCTGELRLETGATQCGKWRDDYGNWFGNNNATTGWHYWLPMGHLESSDLVPASLRSDLTADQRVFPIGATARRVNQESLVGVTTSACNAMPYRDDRFGAEGRDAIFVCEPANNLVLRRVLDYSGATITARRHAADERQDFLAAEDRWFRPVMARTGPDGALYVVDMYRAVLEHPEWIPADMAKRMQLRGGETLGRIWRVAPRQRPGDPPARRAAISLASKNGWARDTAQRLALERGGVEDLSEVRALAETGDAVVRPQALLTLGLLGQAPPEQVLRGLRDLWPRVRGAALVAAGAAELAPEEMRLARETQRPGRGSVVEMPRLGPAETDRRKVVERYLPAAGLAGDAVRGRAALEKGGCVACHRLGGRGVEVGPDLATVGTKPAEQLIESIFDPNRAVEKRYTVTVVELDDGTSHSGVVIAETPGVIVLRMAGGAEKLIKRGEIEDLTALKTSIMPVGLESLVTLQDCADILAALRVAATPGGDGASAPAPRP
jgi:putative membrane-bound dehydrogenase-like protein